MGNLSIDEVLAAIANGDCDSDLPAVINLARERRKVQGESASRVIFHTVHPGRTGRLKDVRPQYLVGAPFTVVGKGTSRIQIRLDADWLRLHPQAARRWSGVVTCPPSMLDLNQEA